VLAGLVAGLCVGEGQWQRWVGELSYPIYVVHILVKWAFLALLGADRTGRAEISGLILLGGAVVASIVIEKIVGIPLERVRQRRVLRST